jgi:hypothetical protein
MNFVVRPIAEYISTLLTAALIAKLLSLKS